jgi:hypothetical protein
MMKPKKLWPALICFLLIVPALPADSIYTWTDENGVKRFSNKKPDHITDFEVIPAVPAGEDDGKREAYLRMMEQVERERRQRELEVQREAAARAEEEKQKAQAERQAHIDAERNRLQRQIDDLNNRALSIYFTQGMRDAQIEEIQKQIDALETEK